MTKTAHSELRRMAQEIMGSRHYHIEWFTRKPFIAQACIVAHDSGEIRRFVLRDGVWMNG